MCSLKPVVVRYHLVAIEMPNLIVTKLPTTKVLPGRDVTKLLAMLMKCFIFYDADIPQDC
jgi:hypothetical protein